MPVDLVCNTGPILALGKMGLLDLVPQLGLEIVFPKAVANELDVGAAAGFPVLRPAWIPVIEHSPNPAFESSLDPGEAAVLDLALTMGIKTVCIDEWRGRRAAHSVGLQVTGSLGMLGRMRNLKLIESVEVPLEKALQAGVRYHPDLMERFLQAMR
jgi:predicted nucleic acid-binding protein